MTGPECPAISTKWQHIQRSYLNKTLAELLRYNVNPLSEAYLNVRRMENLVTINIGFKIPKPLSLIMKLFGLSPGEVRLWLDPECGWLAEWRDKEGAPPVYHYISTEKAAIILKGELTKELETELMTPDEYIGE